MRHVYKCQCKLYRYRLWRTWDKDKPPMVFVMMNPSTADEMHDDPTIARCQGFAQRDGFGGVEIFNVFPLRSTDPKGLLDGIAGPFADENERTLQAIPATVFNEPKKLPAIVVAWGVRVGGRKLVEHYRKAASIVNAASVMIGSHVCCLGTTKDGSPRHPLYVHGDTKLVPWDAVSYLKEKE